MYKIIPLDYNTRIKSSL